MSTSTAISPPPALVTSVSSTVSTVQAVSGAAQQVLALPVPQSGQIPSLGNDVQTAKGHAQQWVSSIAPQIGQSLQGVAAWGGTFDALFSQLNSAAALIGQGQTSAIATFKSLLGQLQAQTTAQLNGVQALQPTLDSYLAAVNGDVRQLAGDQQQLQVVIETTQANLQMQMQQLQQLEAKLNREQDLFNTLGYLDPLYFLVKKLIDALTGQADNAQQQVNALQAQVAQLNGQLQMALQTSSVLTAYQRSTSNISGALGGMLDGWETLSSNFTQLLQSEDIGTFNVFTPALLAAVKSDWDNLAAQARLLGNPPARMSFTAAPSVLSQATV